MDSTKTLPYLSAVLFKDQVFEEDEREFEKKKEKKRKSSEKDLNEEGERKPKLDESYQDQDNPDNPFLRPVKMPRLVKTPK